VASTPEPTHGFEIVRASSLRETRWRNGAGTTREVARDEGAGDVFAWRVSLARLEAPAPFSRFPGVDRVLVPVGDARVVLDLAGRQTVVPPREQCAFAGEATVAVLLPDGPTRCLNVMTRRGSATARIRTLEVGVPFLVGAGETAVLLALGDAGVVDDGSPDRVVALAPLDAVRVRGPRSATQADGGTVVAILVSGRPVAAT
jgi:environmental stress-induced protein Ves